MSKQIAIYRSLGNYKLYSKYPWLSPVLNLKLDGSDASTSRTGGDDFRSAPASPEAMGSWYDGSSQYNTWSGDTSTIDFGTAPFSISFWMNTIKRGDNIAGSGNTTFTSGTWKILIDSFSGNINFTAYGGGSIKGGSTVDKGKWLHIVLTFGGSGGAVKLYRDGVLNSTLSSNYNYDIEGKNFRVGQNAGESSKYFEGGLDDFRMYDRVLTQDDIDLLYAYTSNGIPDSTKLLGWYDSTDSDTITESAGSVSQIDDKSTTGNNLVQATSSLQPTTDVTTINGLNALQCVGDELRIASMAMPSSGNLIITFVQRADNGASGSAFTIDMVEWDFRAGNSSNFFSQFRSSALGGAQLNGGNTTNLIKLWSFVFDWDNQTTSMYKDGAFVDSTDYTTKISSTVAFTWGGVVPVSHGECVIDDDVSDTNREYLEGCLGWKWGIALPAGHTYENITPKG